MKSSDFLQTLKDELSERVIRNPSYSLRAFARSLDYDFSALAKIMRGEKALSAITVKRLATRLNRDPRPFLDHMKEHRHQQPVASGYKRMAFANDAIASDWCHYAILELMRLKTFKPSTAWIAKVLQVPEQQIVAAFEHLISEGLIQVSPSGQWQDLSQAKTTIIGNKKLTAAGRRHQVQVLQKAIAALTEISPSKRDQTSITFAASASRMREAKRRIRAFRRELAAFLAADGTLNQVYHLSVSLYPVTKL